MEGGVYLFAMQHFSQHFSPARLCLCSAHTWACPIVVVSCFCHGDFVRSPPPHCPWGGICELTIRCSWPLSMPPLCQWTHRFEKRIMAPLVSGLSLRNNNHAPPPKIFSPNNTKIAFLCRVSWLYNVYAGHITFLCSYGGMRGSLKRSARAVQLFGRLAVLETHTL